MKSKVNIVKWAWFKHPVDIGDIRLFDEDLTVWDILKEMIEYMQSLCIERYLEDWKIKTISIAMLQLNNDLKLWLEPEKIFIIWRFIDSVFNKIFAKAIELECYEGLVNYKN